MQQVLISLGAFGAAEVRRHGQLWFTQLAHAAGADGVEVRGELLNDAAAELPAIGRAVRERGLALVYSSPEGLSGPDGSLDVAALQRALEAARVVGARRLKMSIGAFGPGSAQAFPQLAQALRDRDLELVIENDQTVAAGTVPPLRSFFSQAWAAGLRLGMTFDIGNWHWTGECSLEAARAFAPQVAYVHCKGVQRQPQRWVAVPLAESAAPWRTILRALPRGLPWAIEYPLQGDDLLAVTREQVRLLREVAATLDETE
jgi:sugar phosphate isomerase/epimerase